MPMQHWKGLHYRQSTTIANRLSRLFIAGLDPQVALHLSNVETLKNRTSSETLQKVVFA